MVIRLQKFVEEQLKTAQYEHDDSVGAWVGWLPKFKGVYAQANSIETVRLALAEILEEHVLLSVRNKKPIKGFSLKLPVYA